MKDKLPDQAEWARRHGKHDLDRLGLFVEMPYLPVKGKPPKKTKKIEEDWDMRRMLAGGPKMKDGTQAGYFDDEFRRVFKGEGKGKIKSRGKVPTDDKEPFVPTGPSKKHSCPGDYFGTFQGFVKEFSPKLRKAPKFKHEGPNCVTNPGKKGGPGYINITIGKYPEYKGGRPRKPIKPAKPLSGPMVTMHFPQPYFLQNPYRDPKKDPPTRRLYIKPKERIFADKKLLGRPVFVPTGPAKWEGGCKGGTFNKFPEWKKDKYFSLKEREGILAGKYIPLLDGELIPPSGYKTMYTTPTLHNVEFCMNQSNWKVYEPTYVSRLLERVY